MAAIDVAGDVVAEVATVVTERTEVGGCLVMDPELVQAELGVGAEGLGTRAAGDAADTCVSGLVRLQAVPPGGGEVTEGALMWLHTLVLEAPVLLQAAALLAREATVCTLQSGPGPMGWSCRRVFPLLVEP